MTMPSKAKGSSATQSKTTGRPIARMSDGGCMCMHVYVYMYVCTCAMVYIDRSKENLRCYFLPATLFEEGSL